MKNYTLKILLWICVLNLTYSCSSDDASVIDGLPDAVVNDDPSDAPPRGLNESWNGHSEELYRQYFDTYVSVYYDDNVERPLEWPYEFLRNVWEYTTDVYGAFGDENILYAVFHDEDGGTSFYQTYFDEPGMSLIDVSLNELEMSDSNMDTSLREISHIVENSSNLTSGSPASGLWGDQWSEIFTYDVYIGLEMEEEAQRVYNAYMQTTSDSPNAGVNWFSDWYIPIYEDYGHLALSDFFSLISNKFPKEDNVYSRDMNLGELVHFFSGATGDDLQLLAEVAFEWSDVRTRELLQARADYPFLDYPFDPVVIVIDLSSDSQISVKYENADGPDDTEGSLKLIDNDTNTKYLYSEFSEDMWIQQEFPEPKIVNRYTLTSGNDGAERDPKNWTLQGSSDGSTWEILDSRDEETFSSRNLTREFTVENQDAYQYYRLYITENAGSSLFQMSEWRLINRTSLLDDQDDNIADNE